LSRLSLSITPSIVIEPAKLPRFFSCLSGRKAYNETRLMLVGKRQEGEDEGELCLEDCSKKHEMTKSVRAVRF
jgi:hypothetical protein